MTMRIRVDKKICPTYVQQQNALYFELEHLEQTGQWAGKPVLVEEDDDALWFAEEPENGLPRTLRRLTTGHGNMGGKLGQKHKPLKKTTGKKKS